MDLTEIHKTIKERWIKSERYELITGLENAPAGAATGGEGYGMAGKFLADLEKNDSEAFEEIKDLVEIMEIKYGKIRRS